MTSDSLTYKAPDGRLSSSVWGFPSIVFCHAPVDSMYSELYLVWVYVWNSVQSFILGISHLFWERPLWEMKLWRSMPSLIHVYCGSLLYSKLSLHHTASDQVSAKTVVFLCYKWFYVMFIVLIYGSKYRHIVTFRFDQQALPEYLHWVEMSPQTQIQIQSPLSFGMFLGLFWDLTLDELWCKICVIKSRCNATQQSCHQKSKPECLYRSYKATEETK